MVGGRRCGFVGHEGFPWAVKTRRPFSKLYGPSRLSALNPSRIGAASLGTTASTPFRTRPLTVTFDHDDGDLAFAAVSKRGLG